MSYIHGLNSFLVFMGLNEYYRYHMTKKLFRDDYLNYLIAKNNKDELMEDLVQQISIVQKLKNLEFFSTNRPKGKEEFYQQNSLLIEYHKNSIPPY